MGFKVYLVISPAHLLQIEIKTIWLSIQFEVSKLCYLPRDETLTPLTPPPTPHSPTKEKRETAETDQDISREIFSGWVLVKILMTGVPFMS